MRKTNLYVVFVPSRYPGEMRAQSLLCKDGRMRSFATFGTCRSCVRVYRRVKAAIKAACETTDAYVAKLPMEDGYALEASGLVVRTVPAEGNPGFCTHSHHSLLEFLEKDVHDFR